MTMPNFLIIGAPKAGTTSVYQYLKEHPQIYLSSMKEPAFFAFEGMKLNYENGPLAGGLGDRPPESRDWYQERVGVAISTLGEYQALFEGVTDEIAIGEASPGYMYFSRSPERIHHYIPEVKLIAILRQPADRAYSSMVHRAQFGLDPQADFSKILEKEDYNIDDEWWGFNHEIRTGFYYKQLKRYYDRFDRSQIKIYLYEDLQNRPLDLVKEAFQFLGVDETFVPDVSRKYLVSAVPKNKLWHKLLTQPNPIKELLKTALPENVRKPLGQKLIKKNMGKPPKPPEVRQKLTEIYKEDILQLQDLIGRDLSDWLK